MLKTRLFGFAVACAVAILGVNPVTAFGAETDTQTVTMSEKDTGRKENQALMEEKINQSIQKWNTLTTAQKNEVYALLEEEQRAQDKLMDKLAALGVLDKNDVTRNKAERAEFLNRLHLSGEFPLLKHKGKKSK